LGGGAAVFLQIVCDSFESEAVIPCPYAHAHQFKRAMTIKARLAELERQKQLL
jgi:hypothetical protein